MSHNSHIVDYSRYFSPGQKVYLVNMSPDRDSEIYESLSGIVTSRNMDSLELMLNHGGYGTYDDEAGKATYKLTSESLGSGVQVLADLTAIRAGNLFKFRMHGTLEMFQRRVVPRAKFSGRIFHLRGKFPLALFRKEWKRITDYLRKNGALPGLALQDIEINLSAGGLGFLVAATNRPTPLSMFFIALDEDPPVCALAETIWEKDVDEGLNCGFRFIHILKSDQKRINNYIGEMTLKSGGTPLDYTRNWVLVDKMVADDRKL